MPKRFIIGACLLLLIWVGWTALAKNAAILNPESVDVVGLLPPPPAGDSLQAATELEIVLRLQNSRSDADVKRAEAENHLTPAAFQTVLGSRFTAARYPAVFELLTDAEREARDFVNKGKEYFARPRPIEVDSRVQPVVDTGRERCYPSGHAARGAMWAVILSDIIPDEKKPLIVRGQEIGWDRVVAGVHFPSDVYSGQVLGNALARAMLSSEQFRERLEAAKKEYKSHKPSADKDSGRTRTD